MHTSRNKPHYRTLARVRDCVKCSCILSRGVCKSSWGRLDDHGQGHASAPRIKEYNKEAHRWLTHVWRESWQLVGFGSIFCLDLHPEEQHRALFWFPSRHTMVIFGKTMTYSSKDSPLPKLHSRDSFIRPVTCPSASRLCLQRCRWKPSIGAPELVCSPEPCWSLGITDLKWVEWVGTNF